MWVSTVKYIFVFFFYQDFVDMFVDYSNSNLENVGKYIYESRKTYRRNLGRKKQFLPCHYRRNLHIGRIIGNQNKTEFNLYKYKYNILDI